MLSQPRRFLSLVLLALALPAPSARAQGLIIDRRPHVPVSRSYEVREVSVEARIREQVAEVRVSQTFHNPGSFQLEAEYLFPMPDEGAIQNFILMVDGREIPGRLLPKDEARRIYEEVVRTKRDPALLEYMGRGLFRTSVFPIPPGADRKVTLRYTQLCRRDRDIVEFSYPFGTQKFTAKPIQRLALTVDIDSRDPIKSVYCPSHDAEIRRSGDYQATVKLVHHDVVPASDFRLVYTLAEGAVGASVLSYRPSESEDGYFLLLASPKIERPSERHRPKTVVFVLDRSGSMSGKKIEQARNALKFVLDNLREGDTFNIIAYDDRVETFKPELQRYSSETRAEAVRYVENIQPGGSTDIDGALKAALRMLQDESRPSYVLFLTDGLPTAGETREMAIAEHARDANRVHARLFAFGVGFDVNARLLDRLSGGNAGVSEYVKPDEDIEAHVSRFYARLTSPVLTRIALEMTDTDINRVYPRDIPDLFEGGQLVLVGRYRRAGRTEVVLRGQVGDDRQTFRFPVKLAHAGEGSTYDFVERLWAIRRVGFLIDQIDLHGKSKELTDELVALSTKYGILTPYTSFLADERTRLHAFRENARRAGEELSRLSTIEGASGVAQRAAKGFYQNAQNAPAVDAAAPATTPGQPISNYSINATEALRSDRGRAALENAGAQRGSRGMMRGGQSLGGVGGMGMAGQPGRPQGAPPVRPGYGAIAKDAEGRELVVSTVRQIGTKTFYHKGDRWIDAEVTPEDEAKAIDIEQFSDAYFRLARSQTAERNQYLTFDEPVTVKLGEQVYRINRPKS
ncbi:MAG: VWA domain-containing protein [Isosphaeraceae bacterium]|nr:VWA domain-containing protein [Isosphaeraceae bacterium]